MSPRTSRLGETPQEERGGMAVLASYTFMLQSHILSSHAPMKINRVLNVLTIYLFLYIL